MPKYLFTLLVSLIFCTSYAQDLLLTWEKNVPLTWEDFKGLPVPGNPYGAAAHTGISYGYTYSRTGNQVELIFEVSSNFNKNSSWSKKEKQSSALLNHEQVHFDITELHARMLRKAFASTSFSADYKAEIKHLFSTHIQAMQQMQERYDEESDHSMNLPKQAEWENFMREALQNTSTEG
jgi:hypothetical protein